jgi:hypothetical protein
MNLFYLSDVRYGGWPTFTAHLARGLQSLGVPAHIFKVGARSEGQHRPFGRGLGYRNLSLQAACDLAPGGLIVVAAKKRLHEAEALLDAGAGLVIHDPTEVKGESSRLIANHQRPLVTVREANLDLLRALGGDPIYIPHPYMQCPVRLADSGHRMTACSISRVDFDKHTDLIADANAILNKQGQRIAIYGAENRLYTHHKLDAQCPGWRDAYRGGFDVDTLWGGVKLARRYKTVVDMSVIVGDGGGTQYTHLEALDAGCNLVLNMGWSMTLGEINPYAAFVETPKQLAALMAHEWKSEDPTPLFDAHDAGKIAAMYQEVVQ